MTSLRETKLTRNRWSVPDRPALPVKIEQRCRAYRDYTWVIRLPVALLLDTQRAPYVRCNAADVRPSSNLYPHHLGSKPSETRMGVQHLVGVVDVTSVSKERRRQQSCRPSARDSRSLTPLLDLARRLAMYFIRFLFNCLARFYPI